LPALSFLVKILFYPAEGSSSAMPYGITYKKITFCMMLHNAKVCAVLHRIIVVNVLVFVMGSVDVVCEVQTELFGAIYEVCRMPYSVVVLHHPPVCM
jgi:hypothetical protein